MSNPESSALCQQQCQQLVARLSRRSHFVDEVRKRILAQPGHFPNLEQVADDLALSPRTLRRRIEDEGSRFQEILDEVRLGLAKDYLANSTLSIEQVAELLGFSHTGNFSHAFKRWSGVPPLEFRSGRV
jgi:AraC-like DNA-binding protein